MMTDKCKPGQHAGTTLTDAVVRRPATAVPRDWKGPGREWSLPSQVAQWPTPTATSYGSSNNGDPGDGRGSYAMKGKASLETMARRAGPKMALNPAWVEELMGFPPGWTAGLVVPQKPRENGSRREPCREDRASGRATEAPDRTGTDDCEPSETPSCPSAPKSSDGSS